MNLNPILNDQAERWNTFAVEARVLICARQAREIRM